MANITTSQNNTICVFNDPKLGEQFCSFSPDDVAGKVKLYNAINSPDERLSDFINTPITIRDVVVSKVKLSEKVESENENPFIPEETANVREGFRVVIIDVEGKSYTATSTGIYNSVSTLRSIFGGLHFEDGLKAMVKQIKTKNGKTLTLALVD